MSIADYAYSNTRIRFMRTLLLKEDEIGSLAGSTNLEDFVSSLRQTKYGEAFSSLDKIDIHGVEKALALDLIRTVTEVDNISPSWCTPLIEAIAKKYEFDYIKLILNSREGDLPAEEITDAIPVVESGKLFASKGAEEFLDKLALLSDANIQKALTERYRGLDKFLPESPTLLDIQVALDRYYFSELWEGIKSLGWGDRQTARKLVSLEIEAANLLILLRAVLRGLDADKFLIPGKGYHIRNIKTFFGRELDGVLKKIPETSYGYVLEEALADYQKTGSFICVEIALKKYIAKVSRKLMRDYPLEFGLIIGFLKTKEIEVENLRAIAISIEEGVSVEKRGALLLTDI